MMVEPDSLACSPTCSRNIIRCFLTTATGIARLLLLVEHANCDADADYRWPMAGTNMEPVVD